MRSYITSTFILISFFALAFVPYSNEYNIGDNITDFKLKNVDDKTVSLADFKKAKGYILVVTCNTCPVSKAYENRLISLNEKYESLGYPLIAINPNDANISKGDSFEQMKIRAKDKNFTFPYLLDDTQEISKQFGAKSTPTAYIITKRGSENILKYKGAIDNSKEEESVTTHYVQNAMEAILKGNEPSVSSTKAIGCGIKWKKDK